jgi:hypothetical protein
MAGYFFHGPESLIMHCEESVWNPGAPGILPQGKPRRRRGKPVRKGALMGGLRSRSRGGAGIQGQVGRVGLSRTEELRVAWRTVRGSGEQRSGA